MALLDTINRIYHTQISLHAERQARAEMQRLPTLQSWGLGVPGRLALPLAAPRRAFSRSAAAMAAADDPAGALVEWVRAGGGTVNANIAVKRWQGADGGSGYGLQVAGAVSAGTPLITLPPALQLTYGAATDPRLMALINKVPAELWGAKLALQLLAQRVQGADSSFAPYIEALPLGFPGLPIFFPPDAVAALQYPPVTAQITKRCRWLLGFASEALDPVRGGPGDPFGGADIDANALGWALAAVTSRAFRVRGPDHPAALLPLIDMANHSFAPNVKIVGTSAAGGGALSMVALRDLTPGEPVLISYGNLPNDFFFLDYGFICTDNPCDTVQLRFDPALVEAGKAVANVGSASGADARSEGVAALPAWQARALETLGLAGAGANTEVSITASSGATGAPVDARLLGGVRVMCAATAGEVEGVSAAVLGNWAAPLSVRNEVATLRTLSGIALIALSQFPGGAEDDVEVLRQGTVVAPGGGDPVPLTPDTQLAVRFRLEKKRLLAAALEKLSGRVKELSEGGGAAAAAGGKAGGQKGAKPPANASGKGFGR